METIIKRGYRKIIHLFYLNKNKKLHLRDIARKANLNENSATRFLKNLEKMQILKSEKDGNLKKYEIQKRDMVYAIFLIFDLEKHNKLPSLRRNAIEYFFDKLQEKPIFFILFGSTAKGNFNKDSDIDLVIIVNKKGNIKKALEYSEAQTGIRINCFQAEYKHFKEEILTKKDKVIASAIATGYPLTNHIKYYEETL